MMYFLAWIIVGFCSALICKGNWEKYLGKYGIGVWAYAKTNGFDTAATPEEIAEISKLITFFSVAILTIVAPYGLVAAVMCQFKNEKYKQIRVVVDEYVKRHGMVF